MRQSTLSPQPRILTLIATDKFKSLPPSEAGNLFREEFSPSSFAMMCYIIHFTLWNLLLCALGHFADESMLSMDFSTDGGRVPRILLTIKLPKPTLNAHEESINQHESNRFKRQSRLGRIDRRVS